MILSNSDSDKIAKFFGAVGWHFMGLRDGSRYIFTTEDAADYCASYMFMMGIPTIKEYNKRSGGWTVGTPDEDREPQLSALLRIVSDQRIKEANVNG